MGFDSDQSCVCVCVFRQPFPLSPCLSSLCVSHPSLPPNLHHDAAFFLGGGFPGFPPYFRFLPKIQVVRPRLDVGRHESSIDSVDCQIRSLQSEVRGWRMRRRHGNVGSFQLDPRTVRVCRHSRGDVETFHWCCHTCRRCLTARTPRTLL